MKPFWLEVVIILKEFILGQFLILALNSLVSGLGFWALGIPHAFWLGAVAGLCSIIPVVGPVVGFVPALIAAWVAHRNGWVLLGVAGVWAVVQALESLVWQPKILGSRLNLSPWVVIPVIFFGGFVFGILGVVLAVPLAAIIQAAYQRAISMPAQRE
ncbi:MAG: AI-2E family transporter [candidate division FCPU426 bacterium]